jgi:hypothetical protein
VRLCTASEAEVSFSDLERVAQSAVPTWRITDGQRWIEGEASVGRVSARLAWRIHRAAIESEDGSSLVCAYDDLEGSGAVRVRGWPAATVRLRLRGPCTTSELVLTQTFDRHGVALVQRRDLFDAFQRLTAAPAATVDIWSGTRWVPTRCAIMHRDALHGWLYDPARHASPEWLHFLDEDSAETLRLLAARLDGNRDPLTPGRKLPPLIVRWVREVMACIHIFGPVDIRPPDPLSGAAPEHRDALAWVLRAERARDDDAEDAAALAAEWPEDLWPLPPWQAWRDRVRDLRVELVLRDALEPLVTEWSADVERGLVPPRSAIGKMPGGSTLTHAYALRKLGNRYAAFKKLHDCEPDEPLIISDLRALLDGLIRHEGGAPFEIRPTRSHRRLLPLLVALHALAPSPGGESFPVVRPSAALPPEKLPLPLGDIALLRKALMSLCESPSDLQSPS